MCCKFYPLVYCLPFYFLTYVFQRVNFFDFDKDQLTNFFLLWFVFFVFYLGNLGLPQGHKDFLISFHPGSLIVLSKSWCSFFFPFENPVDPNIFWEELFSPSVELLQQLCQKSIDHICMGQFLDSQFCVLDLCVLTPILTVSNYVAFQVCLAIKVLQLSYSFYKNISSL